MATIPISGLNSGQSIFSPAVAIFSAANITNWNLDIAQNAVLTMTENTTLMNPTGMSGKAGKWCMLHVIQNGSAAKTLAFDSAYTNGGTLPPISTALSAEDGFLLYCTGTKMEVWVYSQNIG